MTSVRVRILGAGEAADVGARLIRAGDGALKRALFDAVKQANAGIESDIRMSAISHLPKRGGLGPTVARSRISVRSVYGSGVGISVTATGPYNLQGLDEGRNIHPLFGNRRHWYFQAVRPGWFSDAVDGREARTASFIEEAVSRITGMI